MVDQVVVARRARCGETRPPASARVARRTRAGRPCRAAPGGGRTAASSAGPRARCPSRRAFTSVERLLPSTASRPRARGTRRAASGRRGSPSPPAARRPRARPRRRTSRRGAYGHSACDDADHLAGRDRLARRNRRARARRRPRAPRSRSPSSSPRRRRAPGPAATASPVGDLDREHRALHRADDGVRRRRRGRRGRARSRRRRASSAHGGSGTRTLHLEAPAVELDRDRARERVRAGTVCAAPTPVPLDVELGSPAPPAARDSTTPWQVAPVDEARVLEQRAVEAEQRRRAPRSTNSRERPQHPPPRVLAVDAVHDQLGDHRVVEAARSRRRRGRPESTRTPGPAGSR